MPFIIPTTPATATTVLQVASGDSVSVLLEEFRARGYDYLSDTRTLRLLNYAYRELCALYPWPFLEATATALSGDTLPYLGLVLSVVNSTGVSLTWVDRRALADYDLDPAVTGVAYVYYLTGDVLGTYPVDTGTFTVHYVTQPPALAVGDTAYVPAMWTDLLIDCAVLKGLKDDDGDRALLKSEVDERVVRMIAFYDRGSGPDLVPFDSSDIGADY